MTITNEPNTATKPAKQLKEGRVVTIAGPVVDIEFPADSIPEINTAVSMIIEGQGEPIEVRAEVAQQIGNNRVRAICLKPTDGLRRGTPVKNTGRGITVPVGDAVLGHVFNVIGQPLDVTTEELGEVDDYWEIHRPAPAFDALEPSAIMFETGIKVIDLLTPYKQGGKIGLFGGAGYVESDFGSPFGSGGFLVVGVGVPGVAGLVEGFARPIGVDLICGLSDVGEQ